MTATAIREEVRQAMGIADALGRSAGERREEPVARAFEAVRASLGRIEGALSGGDVAIPFLPDLEAALARLAELTDQVAPDVRGSVRGAVQRLRGFHEALRDDLRDLGPSLEIPSKRLLGMLPLVRMVPQDVHTLLDYAHGAACIGSAVLAESEEAQIAGAALGGVALVVTALTDTRLSPAKVLPIEVHEAVDHLWGAAAIAAPFVLGYWRREPTVTAIQVISGATSILASLFTDYRAARGVGHSDEEVAAALADGQARSVE